MLVVCPEDPLFIVCLPVDVDEGLAVHTVDVEHPIQVVHLVLEDTSWPAAGLPRNGFTLLIQTCRVNMQRDEKIYRNALAIAFLMCLLLKRQ